MNDKADEELDGAAAGSADAAASPLTRPDGYGQLCAVSMALDEVGGRWNLLILRDLARTPLRFSDIAAINPGVSPSMLTRRLRAMEEGGIIERRVVRSPARTTLYRITDAMRPPVVAVLSALADLGAQILEANPPASDPSVALAAQMELNGHFVVARGSELHGYFVFDLSGWHIHIVIDESGFHSSETPPSGRKPDATATFFPPTTLLRIMGRVQSVDEAESLGLLSVDGDRERALELLRLLSFADNPGP